MVLERPGEEPLQLSEALAPSFLVPIRKVQRPGCFGERSLLRGPVFGWKQPEQLTVSLTMCKILLYEYIY